MSDLDVVLKSGAVRRISNISTNAVKAIVTAYTSSKSNRDTFEVSQDSKIVALIIFSEVAMFNVVN